MNDQDCPNPYQFASSADESVPVESSSASDVAEEPVPALTWKQSILRHTATCLVVAAFFALGYVAIQQFLERQWLMSFFTASASLMCIPFVDHSSSLRGRAVASLVVPFAMSGLASFVVLYFQMFQIPWFEAVFNDKGSGPLGLILSAIVGLAIGVYIGTLVLNYFGWFAPSAEPDSSSKVG